MPKAFSGFDKHQVAPNSWFLNENGRFQAFEYNANGEALAVNEAFACQLREFLETNGLQGQISIIPNPAAKNGLGESVEFTHPSGSGTITIPLREAKELCLETTDPVITGWSFHLNNDGIVECKGNQVCCPKKNGNHQVFQDSKPWTEMKIEADSVAPEGEK